MGLFDRLFKKGKTVPEIPNVGVKSDGNTADIGDDIEITISSGYLGNLTGSTSNDFYVYEWFIKNTGEIFYVGKGRGDRYKEYHERAYAAERIRKAFDTDVRFVAQNLTEEEALEIESREMTRILNDTNYILTNRITPFFAKRGNGYTRSTNVPCYMFETAPVFYVTQIDEHYFNYKPRRFDRIEHNQLARPAFIQKGIVRDEIEIIYGGDYEKYYNEVISLLEKNGSKIIKTRYAKSVTAWIYPCDDDVYNYQIDEEKSEERIGRKTPVYHLIDVWKYLTEKYGRAVSVDDFHEEIKPINNRVPLSEIRNRNNWSKGFDEGYKYWERGEAERKAGNLEEAIQLFDLARYNGYFAPVLYNSYAMAYRKLKDLDNEIDILVEAIARFREQNEENSQVIIEFEEQRRKALEKLKKRNK